MRAAGARMNGVRRFAMIPAVTTASTPDTAKRVASAYVKNGSVNATRPWRSTSRTRSHVWIASQPHAAPTMTPPATPATNCSAAIPGLNAPVTTTATAVVYRISDEASLSRLSPSTTAIRWRGMRMRSSTGAEASSSVGATTAPSTNAIGHASPGSRRVRRARRSAS